MSNFSVLNESNLHNSLKNLYAFQTDGQTEVEKHNHIYDIIAKSGEIIEIQNQNLKALLPKIKDSLEKGEKIRIVHPVVICKIIELREKDSTLIHRKKSPKRGSIYDIFNEIKGIYEVILNKNFTLEVPEISITEIRTKEDNLSQSKNKKRRFKKDWNKTNKKLNEIGTIHRFNNKSDYLKLLPFNANEEFCAKDLSEKLKAEKTPARIYKNTNLILWVLKKINLIQHIKTEKRTYYYKITM